jgi:multiple sugar transport system substrate-binding protein
MLYNLFYRQEAIILIPRVPITPGPQPLLEEVIRMVEIEFSVMEGNQGDANNLLPLMQAFEQQYHIHVNVIGLSWDRGWEGIAKYGIYRHGPDVSSIGTSWIGSLVGMSALRPFSPQQVVALGGAEAFFKESWQSGFLVNDLTPWAIPWLSDVHVIYYWKDAFEKGGIQDAPAALSSQAALEETLEKLQKSGYSYPLVLTTIKSPVTLHEAAHWVWSAGGDFISPDRREAIFNQPAALEGFKNYFRLRPFISPESLGGAPRGNLFDAREAAVYRGGPWIGTTGRVTNPSWGERLGICPAPGITFVGGSSFVIWQYTEKSTEAFELVRFLLAQPVTIPASPNDHLLPTRRQAASMPSIENDIFHRTYLQAIQTGRSFPTMRLWGLVEDKLVATISTIWAELFANPGQDLDACLHKHFDPLVQRMNLVLED